MWLSSGAVIGGLVLLIWGADRFGTGAAGLAVRLGISTLVIGLTVVGFATSAPEMLVSASAAMAGNPGLAVGNALGSNIANIGLVLGITAIVVPLGMGSGTLRRELPLLLAVTLLAVLVLLDHELGRWDGIILLTSLVLVMTWIVRMAKTSPPDDPMVAEFDDEIPKEGSLRGFIGWLVLGLLVLLGGAQLLVWGAVNIAHALGVSDLVIGLTIVAIGTSLPELAASIAGVLKGEPDIAVGNIIGSNMFNLLAVMGIAGTIQPATIAGEVLTRDYPVMVGMTLALGLLVYGLFGGRGRITRIEGGLLLAAYVGYLSWIYVSVVA
jgi:cation:H+ antiporter